MLTSEEREQLALISGPRARQTLSELVQGTERVVGSPAELEEARRVRDLLQPFVDSCELESYPAMSYVRGQGRLEVIGPDPLEVRCEVNPVAPAGSGEGVLIDVGNGTWRDFRALGNVEGRVALATTAELGEMGSIAREAFTHGVKALVYHIDGVRDDLISIHGVNVGLPVLSVSNQDAARLRQVLSQRREVSVRFDAPQEATQCMSDNVVGVIEGTRFPNEVVYISAHHDTWFQGANDNLSSVAGLVELARLFHRFRPARTVRLISFGGEESGTPFDTDAQYWDKGSKAYSVRHQTTLSGEGDEVPVAIVNAEIIAYTDQTEFLTTQELLPLVHAAIGDLNGRAVAKEPVQDRESAWSGSDHLCFHTLGVPSVVMFPLQGHGGPDLPSYWSLYHTPAENMERVDQQALEANIRAWALVSSRLANGEDALIDLNSLGEVAERGFGTLPEAQSVRQAVQEAISFCRNSDARKTLRQSLSLSRLLHRNLYAFHCSRTLLRGPEAEAAVIKLREAGRLLPQDRARAVEALSSILTAEVYRDLSSGPLERLRQIQARGAVVSRFSPFWLDLSEIWQALEGENGVSEADALSLLDDKAQTISEQSRSWARGLVADLHAFCQ